MPNNEDHAWRFRSRLDKGSRRVRCLFFNKQMSGGITRLKENMAHKIRNVAVCPKASRVIYLLEAYKEMKEYIKSLAPIWDERGVTVMCDVWTGPTDMHIIIFLVYSVRGTIFYKSIGATSVLCKDANYCFKLMKDVLMEKYPHIYWTACVAHCLDLLLENLANKVARFIYHYKWVSNYMKTFTNVRKLLRLGLTRFATNFIMLESVVEQKIALQNMFNSSGWLSARYNYIDETVVQICELFSRSPSTAVAKFWDKVDAILRIQAPIVRLAIKEICSNYKQYWAMIDKRWDFQLHQDLHAAGCYFNPQFLYGVDKLSTDKEIKKGLFIYEQKTDSLASNVAQRAIKLMDPATWWSMYSDSASNLHAIVVKVLSQTTSSFNFERNRSVWSLVHTKTRDRLMYKKLHNIVYLWYNMWLQRKHQTRRSEKEINACFDPIKLDNIFDYPFCNDKDTTWIDIDDDDENDGGYQETREGDNTVIGPPFQYHNRAPHTRESVLTSPSSDDGDGDDDGDRGDDIDVPPPIFTRLTPDAPLERAHQVYERARKGKNAANDPPTNDFSWQGLSGNAVANESISSNIDPYFSYYPNFEPPRYQPSSGYDTTSNS
ncbi:hypothetical protein RND81_02G154500 [Saponaria officinalis]|uniref:DUF659 domain-containing protein n=1 Tax=Saponaria officinalis TaxID=3572 RepID=A0AAW1MLS9_SAPOF